MLMTSKRASKCSWLLQMTNGFAHGKCSWLLMDNFALVTTMIKGKKLNHRSRDVFTVGSQTMSLPTKMYSRKTLSKNSPLDHEWTAPDCSPVG